MKRFRLITFGCRVNQYETQAIREQLIQKGYQEVASYKEPLDVVVINSCTVTEKADRECLATVRALHRLHPKASLVVTGCLVQRDADLLTHLPGVRLLVGSNLKSMIADWVQELDSPDPDSRNPNSWDLEPRLELELNRVYAPLRISSFEGRAKAFLKVQDGCDRACGFCKIPYVRGRSRSRPLQDVLEEARRLVVGGGYEELVLTGVAVGLWGREWEPPSSLADLVKKVAQLPGSFRLRLSSLDPRDLDDRLIQVLGSQPKLCRHLHLSLQSGSDSVLRRMNRGYSTAEYEEKVQAVRRFWQDLGLTTDWIVGFPGETDEEFEESLRFLRRLEFLKVHVFPYSLRRGTGAWFLKGHLPSSAIQARAQRLRQAAWEASRAFRQRFLGTVQEVLVEEAQERPSIEACLKPSLGIEAPAMGSRMGFEGGGPTLWWLTGYTHQFIRVRFLGPPKWVKKRVSVRLARLQPDGLAGEFFRSCP